MKTKVLLLVNIKVYLFIYEFQITYIIHLYIYKQYILYIYICHIDVNIYQKLKNSHYKKKKHYENKN